MANNVKMKKLLPKMWFREETKSIHTTFCYNLRKIIRSDYSVTLKAFSRN